MRPPFHMVRLAERREIAPYVCLHPAEELCVVIGVIRNALFGVYFLGHRRLRTTAIASKVPSYWRAIFHAIGSRLPATANGL